MKSKKNYWDFGGVFMKQVLLLILSFALCLSAASCSETKPEKVDQARVGYTPWQSGRKTGTSVEERKPENYELQEGTADEFTVANYFSRIQGSERLCGNRNGTWKIVLQGTLPASGELGHTLTVSGTGDMKKV